MRNGWSEVTFISGTDTTADPMFRLDGETLLIDALPEMIAIRERTLTGISSGLAVWYHEGSRVAILGSQLAESLTIVAVEFGATSDEPLLRDEQPDLRFLAAKPAPTDSLLVLYERGIVMIERSGTIKWHRLHDELGAQIDSISREEVVITSDWPLDRGRVQRRFRVEDGTEVVGP